MLVKIVKKTYLTLENITLESSLVNTNSMLHKISEENKYLLEIIRKYRDIEPKEHEQYVFNHKGCSKR